MVWFIAAIPIVILILFHDANIKIFGIAAALALLVVTLGNPSFLIFDLLLFALGLVVILYRRWDDTRPRLTPEQQEEQERQRQEAERIRQEKASALADIRGNAFVFGLFTVLIVIVVGNSMFPTVTGSLGIMVVLLSGVLAYQMRVIYLVGEHPLLDQNRDIDQSWTVYSVISLILALSIAYMTRLPPPGSYIRHNPIEVSPPNSKVAPPPAPEPSATPPARRKHPTSPNTDLRHCLELGSDAEIARCATRP